MTNTKIAPASEFNYNTWWEQRKAGLEQERRQRLNATCPVCSADLLHELEYAAYDLITSETVTISCPSCDTEITYRLQWHIEPYRAEILTHTLPTPPPSNTDNTNTRNNTQSLIPNTQYPNTQYPNTQEKPC